MTREVLEIKRKYLHEPSIEQIMSFINEVGVQYTHFEAYYGMAQGTIKNVKGGWKNLPIRYWPIFYDRTIPKIGLLYNQDAYKELEVSEIVPQFSNKIKSSESHRRIVNIKTK